MPIFIQINACLAIRSNGKKNQYTYVKCDREGRLLNSSNMSGNKGKYCVDGLDSRAECLPTFKRFSNQTTGGRSPKGTAKKEGERGEEGTREREKEEKRVRERERERESKREGKGEGRKEEGGGGGGGGGRGVTDLF